MSRVRELPLVEQSLCKSIPVVVLITADLTFDFEALKLRVENEVDNPSDGV